MKCPQCGKFMNRDKEIEILGLCRDSEIRWACKCGCRYTKYGERIAPLFSKDAICLIRGPY